jgi:hypothetical protein
VIRGVLLIFVESLSTASLMSCKVGIGEIFSVLDLTVWGFFYFLIAFVRFEGLSEELLWFSGEMRAEVLFSGVILIKSSCYYF